MNDEKNECKRYRISFIKYEVGSPYKIRHLEEEPAKFRIDVYRTKRAT